MTRLILVRHAESVWNAEHRYQGQSDSGLTERGRRQAERAADVLEQTYGVVDAVWSSDLPRVADTAAPYAHRAGLPVTHDPRLREVDIGCWAGRTMGEVAAEFPAVVAAAAAGEDVRRGEGETFTEVRARVVACLTEIATAGHRTVLVFAHGGSIRVAAAHAAGVPAPGHATMAPPTNCSQTVIELNPGHTSLVCYNLPLAEAVTPADVGRRTPAAVEVAF